MAQPAETCAAAGDGSQGVGVGRGVAGVPSGARSDPGGAPRCSGMGMGEGGDPPSPRAAVSLEEESEYEGVSALGQCF